MWRVSQQRGAALSSPTHVQSRVGHAPSARLQELRTCKLACPGRLRRSCTITSDSSSTTCSTSSRRSLTPNRAMGGTLHRKSLPVLLPGGMAHTTLGDPRAPPPQALADVVTSAAASPWRDAGMFTFSVAAGIILVKLFKAVAEPKLSRKLVHTFSGPLFVAVWVLFSEDPNSRYIAACVPALNGLRLFLAGSGISNDTSLINSVSRSGDQSELLKGPFYYCIFLVIATLFFWRDSPAGLVAISLMCGGDGLADIVGRRFGTAKLPFNSSKSWAGSAAMFGGGAALSLGLITYFGFFGFLPHYTADSVLVYVMSISLAATLVEALPINQFVDDNISVPALALALSSLLIPLLDVSAA